MAVEKEKSIPCGVITLSKNGAWFHDGVEITHKRTAALFNRIIQRNGNGYALKLGRERCPVEVEDAPFFVLEVDRSGDSLALRLSNGASQTLDAGAIEVGGDNVMYARVNDGADRAKFTRPAYYQLTQFLNMTPDGKFFLRVGDVDYPLIAVAT